MIFTQVIFIFTLTDLYFDFWNGLELHCLIPFLLGNS